MRLGANALAGVGGRFWTLAERRRAPLPIPARRIRLRRTGRRLYYGWPAHCAFLIDPRQRRVSYTLASPASQAMSLAVLRGPVASFVLTLEGRHPLHGCAVQIGSQAVGFVGPSGGGKSTLAAAFLLAGYRVLTDDLLGVQWRGLEAFALPAYPEIRLWPASGRRLLPEFDRLPRVVPAVSKRRLDARRFPAGFARAPKRLKALYELRRSSRISAPFIQPMSRQEATMALVRNLYNTTLCTPEILASQFRQVTAIAERIPVRRLLVPRSPQDPSALPALILADLAGVA